MTYKFILNHEIIRGRPGLTLYTGNSASYRFEFAFDTEWTGLQKFATFSDGENTYVSPLINNRAEVPSEFLQQPGSFFFGIYATANDEIKRVSSNIVNVTVLQGAYSKGTKPSAPTKDLWESLISKSVPIIGENGNWLFWDFEESKYVDSGKPSAAQYNDEAVNRRITALAEETVKKEDKTIISALTETSPSITLADNTEFIFTEELEELEISLPQNATEPYICSVVFNSGETPTGVVYTTGSIYFKGINCTGSTFTPTANKHYTLMFVYDSMELICYVSAKPINEIILFSTADTDEASVMSDESTAEETESVTEEPESEPNEVI